MLPPTENSDIPLARRPAAHVRGELRAFRVVGGRRRAPRRRPAATTSQYAGDAAASAIPIPPIATPVGSSQIAPRRSDQSPNSGWIIETEIADASTSTATSVYERANSSLRNGSSAGSAPSGEIDAPVASREGRHRPPVDPLPHGRSLASARQLETAAGSGRSERRRAPTGSVRAASGCARASPGRRLAGGGSGAGRRARRSASRGPRRRRAAAAEAWVAVHLSDIEASRVCVNGTRGRL